MMTRKSFLTGAAASAITGSASAALTCESIAGGLGRARGLLGGAFMGCMLASQGGEPRPYDYEIEYLQSNAFAINNTYINTGYTNGSLYSHAFDIEMRVLHTSKTTSLDLHLTYHSVFFGAQNGNYYTSATRSAIPIEDGPVTLRLTRTATSGSGKGFINDVHNSTFTPNNQTDRLLLFRAGNGAAGVNGLYSSRIYWFRMSIDGETVIDMIPVRVGQVGYLYNIVNGQLYGNAGNGSFSLGPDIS